MMATRIFQLGRGLGLALSLTVAAALAACSPTPYPTPTAEAPPPAAPPAELAGGPEAPPPPPPPPPAYQTPPPPTAALPPVITMEPIPNPPEPVRPSRRARAQAQAGPRQVERRRAHRRAERPAVAAPAPRARRPTPAVRAKPAQAAPAAKPAPTKRPAPTPAPAKRPAVAPPPAKAKPVAPPPVQLKPAVPAPKVAPAVPAAAKPAAPPSPASVAALQTAVAKLAAQAAVLTPPATVTVNQSGEATLTLPATFADSLKQEAAKAGLGDAAASANLTARLTGENYTVTPDETQSAPLMAGQPTVFHWTVIPTAAKPGPLTAKLGADLLSGGAATLDLGTIGKPGPAVGGNPELRWIGVGLLVLVGLVVLAMLTRRRDSGATLSSADRRAFRKAVRNGRPVDLHDKTI